MGNFFGLELPKATRVSSTDTRECAIVRRWAATRRRDPDAEQQCWSVVAPRSVLHELGRGGMKKISNKAYRSAASQGDAGKADDAFHGIVHDLISMGFRSESATGMPEGTVVLVRAGATGEELSDQEAVV